MDVNALVGVEASDMDWGRLKAGTRGIVRTALKKANGLLAAAVVDGQTPPAAAGESGAIRALVEAVTKQQSTVKVVLAPRIKVRMHFHSLRAYCFSFARMPQEISLRDLPEACYPAPDPANKLATARAKQVKEGVQHPFPWVELAEFVPSWANVVNLFLSAMAVRLASTCCAR